MAKKQGMNVLLSTAQIECITTALRLYTEHVAKVFKAAGKLSEEDRNIVQETARKIQGEVVIIETMLLPEGE